MANTKEDHIIWGVEVWKHDPWDRRVIVVYDEEEAEKTLKSFTDSGNSGKVVYRELTPWKER